MFQKKTLRRMKPKTREYAKLCNELEMLTRKLKNRVKVVAELELDSLALWESSQRIPREEVKPSDLDDEHGRQMLSKATKNLF